MNIQTISLTCNHTICRIRFLVMAASLLAMLAACSETQIQTKSELIKAGDSTTTYILTEAVVVTAPMTAQSELKAGTVWTLVGALDEGLVYQTKDQVIAVNSFNMYEAYIVIKSARVVGYYLPVEKTFVRSDSVTINLKRKAY